MKLTFSQSTGLIRDDQGGHVALGWSGRGEGKGNAEMQAVRCVGPLPVGEYLVGPWQTHPRLGPMVAPLTQISGESFGRDDFWIHGPSMNPTKYGQESMGCIVIPRPGRLRVHDMNPCRITVMA